MIQQDHKINSNVSTKLLRTVKITSSMCKTDEKDWLKTIQVHRDNRPKECTS